MAPGERHRLNGWVALIVALMGAGAFLPILDNGFVEHWDDQSNFLENRSFRGLGWQQLRWAWTTTQLGVYQPMAWMLYELEYLAWGLDPRGYHLASLILHAADSALVYALIRTLVARAMPPAAVPRSRLALPVLSGLAAAAFAVHPLRVEVVAWASCQAYLPCAGLALLSVLAYVHSCVGSSVRPGWRLASVALYLVALGFKAVPVGLPFVLLILDVAVLRRHDAERPARALLAEKIPYLLAAVAASAMAIQARETAAAPTPAPDGLARAAAERAATVAYSLTYYLEKTAWPSGLSAYHFRPDPIEPTAPPFVGRLAAVATVGVVAYLLRRRWPGIGAALLSYALLLGPNLGLVPHGPLIVADRYAYIATLPLCVLAAGGLVRCAAGARRPTAAAAAIVALGLGLVAILTAMSLSLCRTWRDSESLWAHALAVGSGRDALLETDLGIELYDAGRVREGMEHLRRAIAIDSDSDAAWANLGIALDKQGDEAGAIAALAEAVRLAPLRSEHRHRLGQALARRGRLIAALEQLREAVRLQPGHAELHVSLGHVLVELGRRDEAIAEFTRALLIAPGHRGAWAGLERLRDRGRPPP